LASKVLAPIGLTPGRFWLFLLRLLPASGGGVARW
jgi:hypothetical protein